MGANQSLQSRQGIIHSRGRGDGGGEQMQTIISSKSNDSQSECPEVEFSPGNPGTSQSMKSSVSVDNNKETLQSLSEKKEARLSTLVVVNDKNASAKMPDPLLARLNEIPFFDPLMQDVESSSFWSKKALKDVQSKIRSLPLTKISTLYSTRLRKEAQDIAIEQGRLTKCVKEIDFLIIRMMKVLTARQKKFASHAVKLGKIEEMTKTLSKCNMAFNECLSITELLNDMLPPEQRLEPFESFSS